MPFQPSFEQNFSGAKRLQATEVFRRLEQQADTLVNEQEELMARFNEISEDPKEFALFLELFEKFKEIYNEQREALLEINPESPLSEKDCESLALKNAIESYNKKRTLH
jgi:hypothetical protein